MFSDVLILAGGVGERLWPASTAERPKQFMRLFGGRSFLQETALRASLLDVPGKIIIITRKRWVDLAVHEMRALAENGAANSAAGGPKIPLEKIVIIGEPCGKNTAPAVALVSNYLLKRASKRASKEAGSAAGDTPNLLVLPSDHIITDTENFVRDAETAAACSMEQNIVVFGIPPRSPETGFGYIEAAGPAGALLGGGDKNTAKVAHFKEKPDEKTAKEYVLSGKWYWNSGLYGFRPDFYLRELAQYAPDVFRAFDVDLGVLTWETIGGISALRDSAAVEAAYRNTPSVSIDYAVSEKSGSVVMVKAAFDWNDAGTWDSLAKYGEAASGLAAGVSVVSSVSSKNNFVYSDVPVVLCGVEDLCVVIKNGKALVMKKGFGNEVKKIVEQGD
ncbi:MAG: mannose-1-phosphate guanylyltransferase [Spirochaetaceae bacterium]|nr:mannose-1-phosphate guanylyltransferase [Spirochaetaceae bacterium]